MLDDSRVDEAFWLFGLVFPMTEDSKKKAQFDALFGGNIEKIIPQFIHMLSQLIKDNPQTAEMWFDFVSQSISYMKKESDKLPDVEYPQEQIEKLMRIQLKK